MIRRGGIEEKYRDHCILKQFCRGCYNNYLIASLQLEKREAQPTTFAELVVLIQTEEGMHASNEVRMKKHIGLPKPPVTPPKPQAATPQVSLYSHEAPDTVASETYLLKRQISEVQAQVATLGKPPGQKRLSGQSENKELSTLRKAVEELRTQVAAMKMFVAQEEKWDNIDNSEVAKLRWQVAELQAQSAAQKSYRDYSCETPSPRVFPSSEFVWDRHW